jgi:hypothetical protein
MFQLRDMSERVAAGVGARAEPVSIELSHAQVERVIHCASDSSRWSLLLSGVSGSREVFEEALGRVDDTRRSRSLLIGLLLLSALPLDGEYVGVAELAQVLPMSNSSVHRYLSTLVEVGLVERDPMTRRYRLANVG